MRISDQQDLKLDLTSINDTLGYLTIDQDNWKYYVYGHLKMKDDKVIFKEKYYNRVVRKEVFYENKNISSDSMEIHFEFYEMLYPGEITYLDLLCQVSSNIDIPIQRKLDKKNSIHILKPESDTIKIDFTGKKKFFDHELAVPKDFNCINVKVTMMFSSYDYSKSLKKIVPRKFIYDGKEYLLKSTFL